MTSERTAKYIEENVKTNHVPKIGSLGKALVKAAEKKSK